MDKVGKSRKKINIRGRPSLLESEVIKRDIRDYFDSGYSAYFCINEAGYAKDTVYTYYKKWTQEIIDKTDFIGQQVGAKNRLVILLDKIINTLYDQMDFLLSKRTNKLNFSLENTILKCNYSLWQLHMDKATVLMTPTLDISLRKVIQERWGIDIEEAAQSSNGS